jgi:hypothetical protein
VLFYCSRISSIAQNMHKMENRSKLKSAKVKVLEGALYKAKLIAELDHLNNKLETHKENYDTVVEYSSKDNNAMDISYGSRNNDEAVHKKVGNRSYQRYGPTAHEIPWNHAHVHGYSAFWSSKGV